MLVLFIECWGSNLLIQAGVGKLYEDVHQPYGIRYESRSFSVRYLVSLAYRKGLISGVKLSIVVPQAIGMSFRKRIGNSVEEFLVIVLWGFLSAFNVLELLLFLCFWVEFGGILAGSVWLVWILCQLIYLPSYLYIFLPVREFLTHSRIYTWFWLRYPLIYVGFLYTVMYALIFSF